MKAEKISRSRMRRCSQDARLPPIWTPVNHPGLGTEASDLRESRPVPLGTHVAVWSQERDDLFTRVILLAISLANGTVSAMLSSFFKR